MGVFLNAGRRPKKAMKVRRDMVMVEMSRARMKDMIEMVTQRYIAGYEEHQRESSRKYRNCGRFDDPS